jgi:hypothetical protein
LLKFTAWSLMLGLVVAGAAGAAEILVTQNIKLTEVWTADNTYNLQDQIYVEPGATLIIEPGVVVASDTGVGGSLAVCRGALIFANGTKEDPVIFTSKADVATWDVDGTHPTGRNPKTGTWRDNAVTEWGNLTIMGRAYISENATPGNTPTFDPTNVAAMEGLVADSADDIKVIYGGGYDDDDSGSIRYLSLRYGGKVIGLNDELNGLSLGGIGRGTDISHIDIMNNVDDGIEIWGGCFNLKYFSIWNIGDDSFDIDQGWRGKAQFGLIVQGYSTDASQGSGVGDNCFETDGAEDSDYQPVTTATIYNCTVVGQPSDGDHGTAWRDNARVQYRNCVFMDIGDELVRFDNDDGDGASGYGHNGTLDWPTTWTTAYNAVPAHPNDPPSRDFFYKAQTSGNLAEMKDSVFFNIGSTTEADNRGVFDPANNNSLVGASPLKEVNRDAPVVKGGKVMEAILTLDPRPDNEALESVEAAPDDGFFTPAFFRGAFDPRQPSWPYGWTAASAFKSKSGATTKLLNWEPQCYRLSTNNCETGPFKGYLVLIEKGGTYYATVAKNETQVALDDKVLTGTYPNLTLTVGGKVVDFDFNSETWTSNLGLAGPLCPNDL